MLNHVLSVELLVWLAATVYSFLSDCTARDLVRDISGWSPVYQQRLEDQSVRLHTHAKMGFVLMIGLPVTTGLALYVTDPSNVTQLWRAPLVEAGLPGLFFGATVTLFLPLSIVLIPVTLRNLWLYNQYLPASRKRA